MLERLLIVGLGSIGRRHVRLARALMPDAQIAVLRRQQGDQHSECDFNFCFTNLDEALQFKPQVAVIANPASLHMNVAVPLARAGCHLLIEKPISNATKDVGELIHLCHVQGTILMTGYNLRFLSSLQYFRKTLQEGLIGRILSVRSEVGQFLPSWRPDSDYKQTVSAKAELGGGVLLELSHEIDYLRWLFGDVKWVNAVQSKQSDLEVDVEDTVHLVLGFASRDEKVPVIATVQMDFIRHDTTRKCTVIGETGTLMWDCIAGTVKFFDKNGKDWQILFEKSQQRDDSYLDEWRHFLKCIDDGCQPLVSGKDGLSVLKIIEAARCSSASERRVYLN